MIKANVSYRIHYQCWHDETCFAELLQMIRDLRPAEEYALFSDDNHTPRALDEMLRRFEVIKDRISRLRELNVKVGINILNSLGHRDENSAYTAPMTRFFTEYTGTVCPGIPCPRDENWLENYLKPCYQAAAKAQPDFIWIDDDLRIHGHGGAKKVGCFCPDCLQALHKATGLPGNTEELRHYFDTGSRRENRRRRQLMLDWNKSVLHSLAAGIERYIHEIDENIIIGQMDGWNSWNGLDYQQHYEAISGKKQQSVWWRPGGGIYRDTTPGSLVAKAARLGRESAVIPRQVTVLQGELENFNYQILHKCRTFAALEPQLFCAAGNTGVAYNIFGDPAAEKFANYLPLVRELKKINPFLDQMVSDNGRNTPIGIHDCVTENERLADRINPEKCWLEQLTCETGLENTDLLKTGLPQGFDFYNSSVYIMKSNIAQSLTHEQIMQVLSRGVYLDAAALQTLHDLGYGAYTGFEPDREFVCDTVERYTSHFLNGEYAGMLRNIRQSFWKQHAWSLIPAEKAEIVSSLEDFCGKPVAPCVSGCFTNTLGGRVFVSGYGEWENIFNTSKVVQLKNIFNYLSGNTLPGWVASTHRMAIWVRALSGGGSCEIFNISMDTVDDAVVKLRNARNEFTVCHADGSRETLSAEVCNGVSELHLTPLKPWEVIHITWKN